MEGVIAHALVATAAYAALGSGTVQVDGSTAISGAVLSGDGKVAAFYGPGAPLLPSDQNSTFDVYVRDLSSGALELVSVGPSGISDQGGAISIAISYDGRFVAFGSAATNLVPGDTNGRFDVFVRDRLLG